MAEKTNISWADATFNPWMGCTKVSPGCRNCYAETLTRNRMGLDLWGPDAPRKATSPAYWRKPAKWNREAQEEGRRRRVFCGSLCDVFEKHSDVTDIRAPLWALIEHTPYLDWLLLTKRPENIAEFGPPKELPNVWYGVSVESSDYANRIKLLKGIPAAIRFVSYEPALGPLHGVDLEGVDWLIYGGESGPGHRYDDESWLQGIWEQCQLEGIAFWMKQRSALRPGARAYVHGHTVQELPVPRQDWRFTETRY